MKTKSEGFLRTLCTSYLGKCKGGCTCTAEKWGSVGKKNRGGAVSGSGGGGGSHSKMGGCKFTQKNQGMGKLKSMSWTCMCTVFALQEDFSLVDIYVDER